MDHIIQEDQCGFLKNSCISVNIQMIYELIKPSDNSNIQAFILSLDFKKCFDKIEFQAIFNAMEFFGFAEYLINMDQDIIHRIQSKHSK